MNRSSHQDASNLCGGISSRVMMQQNRGGIIRYLEVEKGEKEKRGI